MCIWLNLNTALKHNDIDYQNELDLENKLERDQIINIHIWNFIMIVSVMKIILKQFKVNMIYEMYLF